MSELKLCPKWHNEAGFVLEVEGLEYNERAGDKMRQLANDCNNALSVAAELTRTKAILAVAEEALKNEALDTNSPIALEALAEINKMKKQ